MRRSDTAARAALVAARTALSLAQDTACDSAPGPLPRRTRPAVMAHVREARAALDVIERAWGADAFDVGGDPWGLAS